MRQRPRSGRRGLGLSRCGPAARRPASGILAPGIRVPRIPGRRRAGFAHRGSATAPLAVRPYDSAREPPHDHRPRRRCWARRCGGDRRCFRGDAAGEAVPSYTRTVAPLIAEKCAGCHRLGGIAPFRLDTAAAAHKYASLIAASVSARTMPPWPPGAASPAYVGQSGRTLTAAQRAAILGWARAGGPVDGPATPPPSVTAPPARQGETTLDLPLATTYTPQAKGGATDDYRCFLLDPGLKADASVTSARIVPGTPRTVHHVILFRVDPPQVADAERLDGGAAGLAGRASAARGSRPPASTG